jgi:hypothetical protein
MSDFAVLYAKAHEAGVAADKICTPTPMIVGSPTTLFGNDIDPNKPTFYVADGVCGFAWVHVKATTPFGRWLRKTAKVRGTAYHGGYNIRCPLMTQSMERKMAYCEAFAKVLRDAGVTDAYSDNRMD